ncbi:MAG: YbjN domain-containing protein [Candidatus Methylacidiphilales bacterium]|nr:YbjN domain-containing protein [Candidatus Methylacidiphilales bacterium]
MSAFDRVKAFFDRQELKYRQEPELGMLQMHVSSRNGSWQCVVHVNTERNVLSVFCIFPVKAKKTKRALLSETLVRANYGLLVGAFEMDYDDGEIRYKSSMPLHSDELSDDVLHHIVLASAHTFERYFESLMMVIYSDISPAEAVARAEKKEEDPTFDFEAYR